MQSTRGNSGSHQVFLTHHNKVKLGDFGLARLRLTQESQLTVAGRYQSRTQRLSPASSQHPTHGVRHERPDCLYRLDYTPDASSRVCWPCARTSYGTILAEEYLRSSQSPRIPHAICACDAQAWPPRGLQARRTTWRPRCSKPLGTDGSCRAFSAIQIQSLLRNADCCRR